MSSATMIRMFGFAGCACCNSAAGELFTRQGVTTTSAMVSQIRFIEPYPPFLKVPRSFAGDSNAGHFGQRVCNLNESRNGKC